MGKPTDIPEDVWKTARAALGHTRDPVTKVPHTLVVNVARALMAERERCAKIIEEGCDRPVGEPFRNDGVPSKNDKCPHGVVMYEDCSACFAAAIRSGK